MRCERCGLPIENRHELAECVGALEYQHAALTDACKRFLERANEAEGHPSALHWKDFHMDVMSLGSKVTTADIMRRVEAFLGRPIDSITQK